MTKTPEIGACLLFELGAEDGTWPPVAQGCGALAALQLQAVLRKALADRSGSLVDVPFSPFGEAEAGSDLKKHRWGAAGRALCVVRAGFSGSEVWWHLAKAVLSAGGFASQQSFLRAHDGPGGDPFRATGFLARPPTHSEWQATLQALLRRAVRAPDGTYRRMVTPEQADSAVPHMLKFAMPAAFAATGVHQSYLVEPGAWAGSAAERTSSSVLRSAIGDMVEHASPSGLATARRYAAMGLAASYPELLYTVVRSVAAYVAATGGRPPLQGSWRAYAAWVRSGAGEASAGAAALPAPAQRGLPTVTPLLMAPAGAGAAAPAGQGSAVVQVPLPGRVLGPE